jgi:CDP-diglyceride synthetase
MPRSKTRKHHHDYRPPANAVKSKKNRSAVAVGIVFFAIIGIGIAYFAAGSTSLWLLWLIAGAVVGSIGGYYFGRQIDRSFAKK